MRICELPACSCRGQFVLYCWHGEDKQKVMRENKRKGDRAGERESEVGAETRGLSITSRAAGGFGQQPRWSSLSLRFCAPRLYSLLGFNSIR